MKIHLASAGIPRTASCIPAFEELGRRSSLHSLTDSPGEADVILFTELHLLAKDPFLRSIRRTETFRRHREKVFVYNESDRPWCAFPGLYVSMPEARFRPAFQVPWSYYTIGNSPILEYGVDGVATPDLLFSFIGSPSVPCRDRIFELRHPRAHIERIDGFTFYDPNSRSFDERRRQFAELVQRSTFVLCPRGRGTSSIRSYEVMAAGRVPVIIADDWTPAEGLDWERFSVRWPEGDIAGLARHLASIEGQAAAMGTAARVEYETKLVPEVMFDRMCGALDNLSTASPWELLRPFGYPDIHVAGNALNQVLGPIRNAVGGLRTSLRSNRT